MEHVAARAVFAGTGKVSGKTVTIDEVIEDQRRHLNSIDLCMLGAFSSRLPEKLNGTKAHEYPELREAVHINRL
jgi:hypothetical protein